MIHDPWIPSNKIIGGHISPRPIPWQVQVRRTGREFDFRELFCGGTIINRYSILCAARCQVDLYVRTGAFIVAGATSSEPGQNGQTIRIIKVINHPDWNKDTLHNNDISILKLKDPLKFNTNVQKACLPAKCVPKPDRPPCINDLPSRGFVSGWGRTKRGMY